MKKIGLIVLYGLLLSMVPGIACACENEAITIGQYVLYQIDLKDMPEGVVPFEANTCEEVEAILVAVDQYMTSGLDDIQNEVLDENNSRWTGDRYIEIQELKVMSSLLTPLQIHTRYMTDGIFFYNCYSVETYFNGIITAFDWNQTSSGFYISEDQMVLNANATGILTTYILVNGVLMESPKEYTVEPSIYPLW